MGTNTSYGTQIFGVVTSGEEVTTALVGLLPGTLYHYRLVASGPGGTTVGADRTFATPGLPATVLQPSAPALLPIPIFPSEKPAPLSCKKGFVKKAGKCVRRKSHKKIRSVRRGKRRK
jgi:hypothetical protein